VIDIVICSLEEEFSDSQFGKYELLNTANL